jgi:hypothetical protein
LPFLGVTFIVVEHVPAFSVFTELPLALQIFLDDAKTVMDTFDVEAKTIFAFFARHVFEIVFPFFTEQFADTTTTGLTDCTVGSVVGVTTTGALQGVNPSDDVRPDVHASRSATLVADAVATGAA